RALGLVLGSPSAPVAVSSWKRCRVVTNSTLPLASYCVSVCCSTASPVTLPASAQPLSPPPSLTNFLTARPAPSYCTFCTRPPGAAVLRTWPRWSNQTFVVRALLDTAPLLGFTLYTCVW